jgi:hypothetical protein
VSHFSNKSGTVAWDKQVLRLQKIVAFLAARRPTIILQGVELFPAVMESMVSILCRREF